ncbi:MAG TPA: hypothetical protein PLM81_03300 [Ginsengibacter sp.]|nr:hypothetical protein [Chitinophagaceae bacterium]MCZ2396564.1 hypothetical protein [Chitinophagales bacterium]HRN72129.1 hypothetical protein [Ginsengibacter sp.]HRP16497.1 hypothetical protein [Ginsengibacter sp.]HRP43897.1 hypothetical protein [Ginsengibacter sp.]
MNWTKKYITDIIEDLAEENVIACRALFRITRIDFTTNVPTLAVSLSEKPTLCINQKFLQEYAHSENDIKCLLLHEFLHVMLLHTEKYQLSNPLLNIALDAIINSIIHRVYGLSLSGFFNRFYAGTGVDCLLRPQDPAINSSKEINWKEIHNEIYWGKYAADDLFELLEYLYFKKLTGNCQGITLIGNHEDQKSTISPQNSALLDGILKSMDGKGIWSKAKARGISFDHQEDIIQIKRQKIAQWRKSAWKILKKCLQPDKRGKTEIRPDTSMMPILNSHNRRAFTLLETSDIIPFCPISSYRIKPRELATIYLDVSGSMDGELEQIAALLSSFKDSIRFPIHVFSNEVKDAKLKEDKLIYDSTGGTSIACVFEHMKKNKVPKSVIVTDGYTERITPEMLWGIEVNNIRAIISYDGNPAEFSSNKIEYHQLENFRK